MKKKKLEVPPLRDVLPHGGHSEATWKLVKETRERLLAEGVKLPDSPLDKKKSAE